jgi:hypothetical protein
MTPNQPKLVESSVELGVESPVPLYCNDAEVYFRVLMLSWKRSPHTTSQNLGHYKHEPGLDAPRGRDRLVGWSFVAKYAFIYDLTVRNP